MQLGIAFESEENESPVVVSVEPTGAGYGVMQLGDVIIQVDGRPARGHEATSAQLCGIVGEFEVEVRRKGPAPPPSPDTTESDEDEDEEKEEAAADEAAAAPVDPAREDSLRFRAHPATQADCSCA